MRKFFGVLGSLLLVVWFAGCSKQEFVKQQVVSNVTPVGGRTLPGKVDILIIPDNTSSLNAGFSAIQAQFSSFISSISGSWDYHVATALTVGNWQNSAYPINYVLVNPTYNSNQLPDGTYISNTGIVPADRAITSPSSFQVLSGTQTTDSTDYTYHNTALALQTAKTDTYTNFVRGDALLAIIVVTNGAEYSVDPTRSNSLDTSQLSLAANAFINIKGSSSLLRFYPIASYQWHAGNGSDNCLVQGGTAWHGGSYFAMNNYIQGLQQYDSSGQPQLDFCNSSALSNVMTDIATNLKEVQQRYVFSNIVLPAAPSIDAKFQVLKNGSPVAKSHTDGWSYPCDTCSASGLGSVYTITHVVDNSGNYVVLNPPLAQRSGYVIQLNGNARMVGSDTYEIVHSN